LLTHIQMAGRGILIVTGTIVLIGIIYSGVQRYRNRSTWIPIIWVRLSEHETIAYGWEKYPVYGWGQDWGFRSCLVWRKHDLERRFLVFDSYGRPIHPTLRITKDHHQGIWLTELHGGEIKIVGSLNLKTGEFLDVNGAPMNGTLPLRLQAMQHREQKPYPIWATKAGGDIIASDIREK
jgi:hypothetical protein